MKSIEVAENIFYTGCSEDEVVFENMYELDDGMMYNTYLILDEKTAVLDGVEVNKVDEYIEKVKKILNGRALDYIVIHHMEPDHTASIKKLLELYPNITVVMNSKTQKMFSNFAQSRDYKGKIQLVNEGDEICLGKHKLKFIFAPMVHWPEVMMSYESYTGTLFTADAFGAFGSQTEHTGSVEIVDDSNVNFKEYSFEMREYYSNIVGKYGVQVLNTLKKLEVLDIKTICSLHGIVLKKNIKQAIALYKKWAGYIPENDGILIVYGTMYGNTEAAVRELEKLIPKNIEYKAYNLAEEFMYTIVADTFKYKNIILAAPTYNGTIFPQMKEYLDRLIEFNMQNRNFAVIENGTWAPVSGRLMKEKIATLKNCTVNEKVITIYSSHTKSNVDEMKEILKSYRA